MPDVFQSFATLPVLTPHPTFSHTNTNTNTPKSKKSSLTWSGGGGEGEEEEEELIVVGDGGTARWWRWGGVGGKDKRRKLD